MFCDARGAPSRQKDNMPSLFPMIQEVIENESLPKRLFLEAADVVKECRSGQSGQGGHATCATNHAAISKKDWEASQAWIIVLSWFCIAHRMLQDTKNRDCSSSIRFSVARGFVDKHQPWPMEARKLLEKKIIEHAVILAKQSKSMRQKQTPGIWFHCMWRRLLNVMCNPLKG
jgi:hypothetical protein